MSIKIIVGLGNYPEQYAKTRHNIGFMVIDKLCQQFNLVLSNEKFNGRFNKTQVGADTYIVAEPLTYMNLSGDFVSAICGFYKINHRDILIVSDDADNKIGSLRLRSGGSSGGQNGVKDIINKLGTDQIARLKLGIGRPNDKNIDLASYVLSEFHVDEKQLINKVIHQATEVLVDYIHGEQIGALMNKYNAPIK
jgi:PTH1 family peptidyl-tRNA hydrolase